MTEYYESPAGERVEIPAGSEIERDDEGNIRLWRNPPVAATVGPPPDRVEDYEAKVDRSGGARRVLAHITDEVDVTALGARNTVPALAYALTRDTNTPQISQPSTTEHRLRNPQAEARDLGGAKSAEDQVEAHLTRLIDLGLVEQRDDGSYALTDEGRVELRN